MLQRLFRRNACRLQKRPLPAAVQNNFGSGKVKRLRCSKMLVIPTARLALKAKLKFALRYEYPGEDPKARLRLKRPCPEGGHKGLV